MLFFCEIRLGVFPFGYPFVDGERKAPREIYKKLFFVLLLSDSYLFHPFLLQIVHQGGAFGVGGGTGFEEVGLDEIGVAELADPGAGGRLGFVAVVDRGEA